MEKNIQNSIINNITIQRNLIFFKEMQQENQNQCSCHLPIMLSDLNASVLKDDKFIPVYYTKCLLCGKNLTYEPLDGNDLIFNAINYQKEKYKKFHYIEQKYWDLVIIFNELLTKNDDIYDVYEKFEKILNNEKEYTLKRTN